MSGSALIPALACNMVGCGSSGGCSYNGFIVLDYAWGDPGDKVKAGQKRLHEGEAPVAPQAAGSTDALPVQTSDKADASMASVKGSLGLLAFGAVGLQTWRNSVALSSRR
jgi:hypothetical protein